MGVIVDISHACEQEVKIFSRVFGNGDGQISSEFARQLLNLELADTDRVRMHELLERNQEDALTATEKKEMFAFAKATSLLGALKSKARLILGVTLEIDTAS